VKTEDVHQIIGVCYFWNYVEQYLTLCEIMGLLCG